MFAVGIADGFIPEGSRIIVKFFSWHDPRGFGWPGQGMKFTFEQAAGSFPVAAQESDFNSRRGRERPRVFKGWHLDQDGADDIGAQGCGDVGYGWRRGFITSHQDLLGVARTPCQTNSVYTLHLGTWYGDDEPITHGHGFDPSARRSAGAVADHIDVELSPVWTHGSGRVGPHSWLLMRRQGHEGGIPIRATWNAYQGITITSGQDKLDPTVEAQRSSLPQPSSAEGDPTHRGA